MCPLCWAALIAQVVFWSILGIFLVVVTDLKFGLPLGLLSVVLSAGNMRGWWGVPIELLYVLGAILLLRGVWVLVKHEKNWVRRLGVQIGGWLRRVLRPMVGRLKGA